MRNFLEKQFENHHLIKLPTLEAKWWAFALRGLFSVLFGVLAIFVPAPTLFAITICFGAYAIVDGIFCIISGINSANKDQQWMTLMISGLLSIIGGTIVLSMPQISIINLTIFLWLIIALWAISNGVLDIFASIQ
jgi:uncharacterized membrane protein HdeD (DUF308 family)